MKLQMGVNEIIVEKSGKSIYRDSAFFQTLKRELNIYFGLTGKKQLVVDGDLIRPRLTIRDRLDLRVLPYTNTFRQEYNNGLTKMLLVWFDLQDELNYLLSMHDLSIEEIKNSTAMDLATLRLKEIIAKLKL